MSRQVLCFLFWPEKQLIMFFSFWATNLAKIDELDLHVDSGVYYSWTITKFIFHYVKVKN